MIISLKPEFLIVWPLQVYFLKQSDFQLLEAQKNKKNILSLKSFGLTSRHETSLSIHLLSDHLTIILRALLKCHLTAAF